MAKSTRRKPKTHKKSTSNTTHTHTTTSTNNKHTDERTEAIHALSGSVMGTLVAYVMSYGSNTQRKKANQLRSKILSHKDTNSSSTQSASVPWNVYRQELYVIAGDWLFSHAANFWRNVISCKMRVPVSIQQMVLEVQGEEQVGKEKKKKKVGRPRKKRYVRQEKKEEEEEESDDREMDAVVKDDGGGNGNGDDKDDVDDSFVSKVEADTEQNPDLGDGGNDENHVDRKCVVVAEVGGDDNDDVVVDDDDEKKSASLLKASTDEVKGIEKGPETDAGVEMDDSDGTGNASELKGLANDMKHTAKRSKPSTGFDDNDDTGSASKSKEPVDDMKRVVKKIKPSTEFDKNDDNIELDDSDDKNELKDSDDKNGVSLAPQDVLISPTNEEDKKKASIDEMIPHKSAKNNEIGTTKRIENEISRVMPVHDNCFASAKDEKVMANTEQLTKLAKPNDWQCASKEESIDDNLGDHSSHTMEKEDLNLESDEKNKSNNHYTLPCDDGKSYRSAIAINGKKIYVGKFDFLHQASYASDLFRGFILTCGLDLRLSDRFGKSSWNLVTRERATKFWETRPHLQGNIRLEKDRLNEVRSIIRYEVLENADRLVMKIVEEYDDGKCNTSMNIENLFFTIPGLLLDEKNNVSGHVKSLDNQEKKTRPTLSISPRPKSVSTDQNTKNEDGNQSIRSDSVTDLALTGGNILEEKKLLMHTDFAKNYSRLCKKDNLNDLKKYPSDMSLASNSLNQFESLPSITRFADQNQQGQLRNEFRFHDLNGGFVREKILINPTLAATFDAKYARLAIESDINYKCKWKFLLYFAYRRFQKVDESVLVGFLCSVMHSILVSRGTQTLTNAYGLQNIPSVNIRDYSSDEQLVLYRFLQLLGNAQFKIDINLFKYSIALILDKVDGDGSFSFVPECFPLKCFSAMDNFLGSLQPVDLNSMVSYAVNVIGTNLGLNDYNKDTIHQFSGIESFRKWTKGICEGAIRSDHILALMPNVGEIFCFDVPKRNIINSYSQQQMPNHLQNRPMPEMNLAVPITQQKGIVRRNMGEQNVRINAPEQNVPCTISYPPNFNDFIGPH